MVRQVAARRQRDYFVVQEESVMIIFVRKNLIMRTLSMSDVSAVYGVVDINRAYLRKWLPWVDSTDSPAVTESVIASWEKDYDNGNDVVLGIFENGKYVGNIGLHSLKRPNRSGMVGYWLSENAQGRGIVTDCVRALMDFGYGTLDLNRIYVHCAADNTKSRAVPEKLGFVQEGILQDGEHLYGVYHDLIIYGMVKRNWQHFGSLCLIFPTIEHKQAALEYKQEYIDCGENHIHGSSGYIKADDYESWLEKITWNKTEATPDWVTGDVYFAFVGDKIVGTIAVRHTLNDALLKSGGHIGYGVCPSERRKGYGVKMLALALEKCRALGIDKALITCDKGNVGSAKTILKNGGMLENEFTEENGNILQRYWITLNNTEVE